MIETGAEYAICFGTHNDQEYKYGVAKSFNHPLIEFVENSTGKIVIYNLSSLAIFSVEKR